MKIHYLEIVTPEVDAVCENYEATHGVSFTEPVEGLGGARTCELPDGSLIGVRPPLRDDEAPIVRPYWLVEDIEKAVVKAKAKGAMIAHPPMKLEGFGTFAILIHGGIDHGLWQL